MNKVGAHCKGAIFRDGCDYITPELTKRVNAMMAHTQELCFGRFDVMIEDLEELKKGRGIKVIEFNGVTSESTHIYDSKFSIFEAWAVLFRQWNLAYQIGYEQLKLGHKSSSLWRIIQQVMTYRKKVVSYSGVSGS